MEKQEKAYKGVIEYFKNRIMAGELRPGEKLPPEREIAQMLEVSRNSVREALRIMDMTGVISSQQGSGNYITCEFQKSIAETMGMMFAMSQINYQQISQIRYALEQQAFALAIEQASESQMEALEELVKRLDRSMDEQENARIDKQIHFTLALASGNVLLLNNFRGVFRRDRYLHPEYARGNSANKRGERSTESLSSADCGSAAEQR